MTIKDAAHAVSCRGEEYVRLTWLNRPSDHVSLAASSIVRCELDHLQDFGREIERPVRWLLPARW